MGTGIPVPAVIPEGSKAFILCVPDDPFFYGVVMGALKVMTFRYYWQGSPEQKDAVTERMLTMYYDYQEQVGCMICEMVAQCFIDQDPDLMAAVAEALRSNPLLLDAISQGISENGGGTPGKPISEEQAQQDTLPENVRDEEGECIPDALWGAMLYAVQSGNRGITDFFQILQAAVEVVEASAIILQNVPAVGGYAASAAQFAAKMQTVIAANYAAAYTESYEESLACDLFCRARANCDMSIDDFIDVLNARLTAPLDIGDMGEIMVGIGSGTWVGDEVADVAFLVYFSALKFGQQFGDKIGIRPLTQLMSLGADQLASDNWATLCDCPGDWEYLVTLEDLADWTDYAYADKGVYVPGFGWDAGTGGFSFCGVFGRNFTAPTLITSVTPYISAAMTGDVKIAAWGGMPDFDPAFAQEMTGTEGEIAVGTTLNGLAIGYQPNSTGSGAPNFPGYTYQLLVKGYGYQPPELGG